MLPFFFCLLLIELLCASQTLTFPTCLSQFVCFSVWFAGARICPEVISVRHNERNRVNGGGSNSPGISEGILYHAVRSVFIMFCRCMNSSKWWREIHVFLHDHHRGHMFKSPFIILLKDVYLLASAWKKPLSIFWGLENLFYWSILKFQSNPNQTRLKN